ncbi:MAG: hypothetical protein WD341_01825 [Tistlia sp.]|uniref:hypothetical protein n=1 Tax=Tistlia sp. TaxID=3057121 RepID=UPI0034A1EED8
MTTDRTLAEADEDVQVLRSLEAIAKGPDGPQEAGAFRAVYERMRTTDPAAAAGYGAFVNLLGSAAEPLNARQPPRTQLTTSPRRRPVR